MGVIVHFGPLLGLQVGWADGLRGQGNKSPRFKQQCHPTSRGLHGKTGKSWRRSKGPKIGEGGGPLLRGTPPQPPPTVTRQLILVVGRGWFTPCQTTHTFLFAQATRSLGPEELLPEAAPLFPLRVETRADSGVSFLQRWRQRVGGVADWTDDKGLQSPGLRGGSPGFQSQLCP